MKIKWVWKPISKLGMYTTQALLGRTGRERTPVASLTVRYTFLRGVDLALLALESRLEILKNAI